MKRLLLSKGWTVRRPGGAPEAVDLPHDGSVSLPRDPAAPGAADTGYFVSTDLCYSRVLRVPAEARHAILDLDGAYLCAAVTLNGSRLSMHPHGYAPWLVDLSAGVHPGGAAWTERLAAECRRLDPTRAVTSAFCELWDLPQPDPATKFVKIVAAEPGYAFPQRFADIAF